MIISHKYKYIFIHCGKTGGSSITVYLNKFHGPWDLQVGVWSDSIMLGGKYNKRILSEIMTLRGWYLLIKNTIKFPLTYRKPILRKIINQTYKDIYEGVIGKRPHHPLAIELKMYAPKEFDDYFKFCFVRNPYSHAVSKYKYILSENKKMKIISFYEFLSRCNDGMRPDPEKIVPVLTTNWPFYTIDDRIVVDYIGRYENLYSDMKNICSYLGVPFYKKNFPWAKKGAYNNSDYRNWYTESEKRLVKSIYNKEIVYFNYDF